MTTTLVDNAEFVSLNQRLNYFRKINSENISPTVTGRDEDSHGTTLTSRQEGPEPVTPTNEFEAIEDQEDATTSNEAGADDGNDEVEPESFIDVESYLDEYDRRQAGDKYESLQKITQQRRTALDDVPARDFLSHYMLDTTLQEILTH